MRFNVLKVHISLLRGIEYQGRLIAWEWLFNDLSEQRLQEIASYQYPSEQMQAHTIYKDYLLREDPTEACEYLQQTGLFS